MPDTNTNNAAAVADRRYLTTVIIALLAFAVIATAVRSYTHSSDGWPAGDSVWSATLRADVSAPAAGALVHIASPWDTRYVRLYGMSLSHPGMKQKRNRSDASKRDLTLVAPVAGEFSITLRLDLHQSHIPRPKLATTPIAETTLATWLGPGQHITLDTPQVRRVVDQHTLDKPDTEVLVERLYQHVSDRVRPRANGRLDGEDALQHGSASVLGMQNALASLLRASHLPARIVTGLDLDSVDSSQPRYWLEYYLDDRWQPIDVANGIRFELPAAYVPLRRGGDSVILTGEGASLKSANWRLVPAEAPRGVIASESPGAVAIFDLTRLPPDTRALLGLLLLLPLGVLLTETLRQLLGVHTSGTFTPTLLALAAVYADRTTALLVFTLVTLIAGAGRSLMPGLQLARGPRLSVIFIMVAMAMTLVVSALLHLDSTTDSAVVLLPVVILTMLVDRIYAVADKYGSRTAVQRLVWTVLATLMSLMVLLQTQWGEFILVYPEIHAVTLAVIMLLGPCRDWCDANLPWLRTIRVSQAKASKADRDDE